MRISVVIPVYNAENFLPRTIESVLEQTHMDLEIILVDDCSQDSSRKICQQYAARDSRIRLFQQKRNSGPGAARNLGIRQATGDFIFFLDADDSIPTEDILQKMLHVYSTYPCELVLGNFSKLETDGQVVPQKVTFKNDEPPFTGTTRELDKTGLTFFIEHFLQNPSNHLASYCWARLYRRSIILKHHIFVNEDMRLFEDFVFNLEYLRHTDKLVFVNEDTYRYTMHNTHASASMSILNASGLLHDMEYFKERAFNFLKENYVPENEVNRQIGHALSHYLMIFLVRSCRWLSRKNWGEIRREIRKLTQSPLIKECLCHYSPQKGNSRIIPILLKYKQTGLLMIVAWHKAYRRYGKPRNPE